MLSILAQVVDPVVETVPDAIASFDLKEFIPTGQQLWRAGIVFACISAVVSMRQAERDKALEKTEDEPGADTSIDRQVTLLNRMMRFFGRNIDPDG